MLDRPERNDGVLLKDCASTLPAARRRRKRRIDLPTLLA
jgi:hypothetical protein